MSRLRITMIKSDNGFCEGQKATVRALGLRHLNQSVEQEDNAPIRGMINKVKHLVKVEEI
jgi:large subunit ribosomal protein L30